MKLDKNLTREYVHSQHLGQRIVLGPLDVKLDKIELIQLAVRHRCDLARTARVTSAVGHAGLLSRPVAPDQCRIPLQRITGHKLLIIIVSVVPLDSRSQSGISMRAIVTVVSTEIISTGY